MRAFPQDKCKVVVGVVVGGGVVVAVVVIAVVVDKSLRHRDCARSMPLYAIMLLWAICACWC